VRRRPWEVPGRGLACLVALCITFGSASAAVGQESDSSATAAARNEKSRIKPVAERQLGKRARPTVKTKQQSKASEKREVRLSLQIPSNLKKILLAKIDKRIARNVAKTKKLRLDAMKLLDKFIQESPEDAPEMAEALLRMGELEWEDSRDRFIRDFEAWEKKPADTRGEPPNPSYDRPRSRFLKVLKKHKTFDQYDLALYVDGFLANEEGKFKESLGRFNKILEWFPNSRFVADAHMVRAEYEFTKEFPDFQNAYNEYEEVLKHKDSELYDIALFKSAWCLWRLNRTDEAAKRFLAVFKSTENLRNDKRRTASDIDELQAEALKNLVAVFVEDEKNRADDMYKFLVKAGGEKFAGRIVKALAEKLYEQANYERGIEAYRLLLRLEPMNPNAYKYALAIAQGHSTMEEWAKLRDDYKWIIKEYVPPGGKKKTKPSAWVNAQSQATRVAAARATEQQLRDDAVGLHAKAQADKTSKGQYRGAADLYQVYLTRFATGNEAYEIHFNLGEIAFYHLEDAGMAADNYMAAVRLNPKGKYSRDALYNALAALEYSRSKEFEAAKASGKKAQESPTDKKLTEAMELYIKTYPNDPDVPELLFRQGKLYYDYEVYDPAVRQWGLLLEKYPRAKYAAPAGELILDSFNKSRDYENIETWARRMKTAPAFVAPEQQKRLNTLIVQAVFKQGEQHAEAGRHDKAATAYIRAAKEFPNEPRAAKAAVNAEIEAKKAGDMETLKVAAAILIADHKQRDEAAQGTWIAANTFQEVGLFSEAADYHEVIAENWPRFEHHKDAAFNAVLLRTTVGETNKAIDDGNKFKRYYPRDEASEEVTFLMGKAYEKAEKWKDAATVYDRYSRNAKTPNGQIEALARLAAMRVKLGESSGAANALQRANDTYKQKKGSLDDTGKYFAAKARYMQGERILAEFDAIKIEGDVKQLKQRLKRKGELLKKAADTFLSTVEMGVAEWTTASLYQIGFTYESFTQSLLNSPPPASLSKDEAELYKQQIDEFVVPIEERALEAYENGWKKALELGIFNAWTAKMREALGRLNAELYPPMKEIGFELRSKGPAPLPGLIEGTRRSKENRSEDYLIPAPKLAAKKKDVAAGATKEDKKDDKAKKAEDDKKDEEEKKAEDDKKDEEEKAAKPKKPKWGKKK
jgi:cellulose synthase operon protein C